MGGLPDEGTFDWLDKFLEDKPDLVELSDRKIVDWALKSGVVRPSSAVTMATNLGKNSNDKPDFCYGIAALDDCSVRKVIANMASLAPRNYVVMEVKSNLVSDERASLLSQFPADKYKRIAHVVMGEPAKAFKNEV